MKARAGVVGRKGLAPVLTELRVSPARPGPRVHLVGHSFGGRLVSFALAGFPSADASPVASLVLVQAAFSHYAFSTEKDNPFGKEGALRPYVDRVHGPLVATWSEFDWAVGRWYPKASALARQDNQANPAVTRWGGLGAGGFQAVEPLESIPMRDPGEDYGFAAGRFYTVDGSGVIADFKESAFSGAHSDIRRPEVAWLIANAAAAGAEASGS
jgi:pimeloyl-ACP methyl ester carboxylesterase